MTGLDLDDYRPSSGESFMSERQLSYYRNKLLHWREQLFQDANDTLQHLQEESLGEPDVSDRASSEAEWSVKLRARDRQRKLVAKINAALRRIESGTYGYCEVTGEPIGLNRLDARPIATMTIEAQEGHERWERAYKDD